jgi:RNA polymerase sigma factor (sigma-70 family)
MKQPNVCTDASLRAAILTGDALVRVTALESFVKGMYAYVFHTLSGYAANQRWTCATETVWDACTDAYVEFKKNTAKPGFSFQKEDTCAYFFKIARNILSQRLRPNNPKMEAYDQARHDAADPNTPESQLNEAEMHRKLWRAIQQLNPEEREILACSREGYKIMEIAAHMQAEHTRIKAEMEALGLKAAEKHLWTEPYTKIRLYRAKQKLRDILGGLDE